MARRPFHSVPAILLLAGASVAAAAEPQFIPAPPVPPARAVATGLDVPADYRTAADQLDEEMRRWLRTSGPARRDGYLYTMDVAPLLLYAAQRGDQTLYLQLLTEARKLIVDDPRDPYTRGFVLQRTQGGQRPDLTGAAEALWMARALWTGAAGFNRADDRALALQVMEGYARHAYELQNVWLVRKYFAFEGRAFAGLSTVAAYHADFMADLEQQAPRGEWRGFAERSYAAIERARAPSAMLYPIIQPEVGATYPDLAVTAYAPNGIASLAEACSGATGVVRGRPEIAANLLAFAGRADTTRSGRLYGYYQVQSGDRVGLAELNATGYACLGLLAAQRNDARAFRKLMPWLLEGMRDVTRVPSAQTAPLHEGAQQLLTAYAAGAFNR